MDAHYDQYGKLIFGGGDDMQPYEEGLSRPTVEQVKARFGEDSAELYSRALEREFVVDDIVFADATNEENEALKSLRGWNVDRMNGSAEYFVREIALEYKEVTNE